jgi:hypothetical protein
VERTLSTVEEMTREVPRITKTIYRKETRNPVDLVNPVKGLGFGYSDLLCVFVALCEKNLWLKGVS